MQHAADDDRIDQLHALATAWSATATTGSDYHKAIRACADQVLGVLTDPQMSLGL